MQRVASSLDPAERRRAFEASQRQLAAHLPILHFVAPTKVVPMSARVRGATPTVMLPAVLWNAEQLYLSPADPPSSR